MIRYFFLLLFFLISSSALIAQNTYLPPDASAYLLLDKLETESGAFSNDLFLSNKGISGRDIHKFLLAFRNEGYNSSKTEVDNFNIFRTLSQNGEWAGTNVDGAINAQFSLGPFYKTQDNFIRINKDHFFFVFNPILGLDVTGSLKPDKKIRWNSAEGFSTRARIGDFLGISFQMVHHNLDPVSYEQQHFITTEAVPGAGKYWQSGNHYEYFDFTGNLSTDIIRNHISLDVGYGRHFIGDGIRSLFLSDNAGSAPYVGINTKVWRINYQNLFFRLNSQSFTGVPNAIGNKYAALHYLNMNIRPWLNVGLFETVVFSRSGSYDIAYLNPIIFYRSVERSLGSPDKVTLGINAKAIVAQRLQLYGQFLLNEFTAKYFFKHRGYWANKWGTQLGLKYFDAFNLANFYVQAELNMVRPYTYSHYSMDELPIDNFTTWNQPLADPLGAGFQELIVRLRYQPVPRFVLDGRIMLYRQGVDTGSINLGNDIFTPYNTPRQQFGVRMINGPEARCIMTNLEISYQWKPNFFLFVGGTYRGYTTQGEVLPNTKDAYFNAGFRLNLERDFRNWY